MSRKETVIVAILLVIYISAILGAILLTGRCSCNVYRNTMEEFLK